jgi:survival of motor neuron-related-splicing factor 30
VGVLEQLVAAEGGGSGADAAAGVAAAGTAAPTARSAKPVGNWRAGEQCEARYADGRWYRARVAAVAPDRRSFTVTYEQYGETEELDADRLRPLPPGAAGAGGAKRGPGSGSDGEGGSKRAAGTPAGKPGADARERKVQRSKERAEYLKAEAEVAKQKQNTWKTFAQKRAKTIPGVSQRSIFASPEGHVGTHAFKHRHACTCARGCWRAQGVHGASALPCRGGEQASL